MNPLYQVFDKIKNFLSYPLFRLGQAEISLWTMISLLLLFIAMIVVSRLFRKWIIDHILRKANISAPMQQTVGTFTQYLIMLVGLIIIFQTVGIDLTALNVLAGAIGIGVGFGLQDIANNFISGLIILLERPVKVGDRIEVGSVDGDVVRIGARSTTVLTNDNIAIVIPNSRLISENVVNWSHNNEEVRFHIPVSVAYGSNLQLVSKVLWEIALNNPDVLKTPEPEVRFLSFGDSGLFFELLVWTETQTHVKQVLISNLNFAIDNKFREYGIQIPFPQRDVHIRSRKNEEL